MIWSIVWKMVFASLIFGIGYHGHSNVDSVQLYNNYIPSTPYVIHTHTCIHNCSTMMQAHLSFLNWMQQPIRLPNKNVACNIKIK